MRSIKSVVKCLNSYILLMVFAGKPGNDGTLLGLKGWHDQTAVS